MAYERICHKARSFDISIISHYTAAIITDINDSVHWASPHLTAARLWNACLLTFQTHFARHTLHFRNLSAATPAEGEDLPQLSPTASVWDQIVQHVLRNSRVQAE